MCNNNKETVTVNIKGLSGKTNEEIDTIMHAVNTVVNSRNADAPSTYNFNILCEDSVTYEVSEDSNGCIYGKPVACKGNENYLNEILKNELESGSELRGLLSREKATNKALLEEIEYRDAVIEELTNEISDIDELKRKQENNGMQINSQLNSQLDILKGDYSNIIKNISRITHEIHSKCIK